MHGVPYLSELKCRYAQLYLANVNIQDSDCLLYEVISQEPGKLECFLIGEVQEVIICGTTFIDKQKEQLRRRYSSGEIEFEELIRLGGTDGLDPDPQGDYLLAMFGSGQDRDIVGSPSRKYDLKTGKMYGDFYRMIVHLKNPAVQGSRINFP